MVAIEKEINSRTYYNIPVSKLPNAIRKIKDGDIFMLTNAGRDPSHLGFAIHQHRALYLMHASSAGGG